MRLDHRFATGRDQAFGRLTYFHGHAVPVTAFPDGERHHPGRQHRHRTAGHNVVGVCLELSTHLLDQPPERGAHWGYAASRPADGGAAAGPAGAALNIPGIPTNAQFPNTMPTFVPNGYQQLGSPINTASDFNTSVTQIADSLTWLKGRHTVKMGLDWRWERLNVVQPPWPTGRSPSAPSAAICPGVTNTGNPFASFLLGQVQTFAIDFQQTDIQERAHFQEYFIQDDWKVSDRLTINPGLRYTLNFPSTEINGQTAVFNLETRQLDYPGTEPVRPLKKDNFGPRIGAVYRLTDKTIVSSGYGLVWIEMAGITTPFTTPTFPFLHEVSQRTLDNISPAFRLSYGPP